MAIATAPEREGVSTQDSSERVDSFLPPSIIRTGRMLPLVIGLQPFPYGRAYRIDLTPTRRGTIRVETPPLGMVDYVLLPTRKIKELTPNPITRVLPVDLPFTYIG